jgi:hypothetical protein
MWMGENNNIFGILMMVMLACNAQNIHPQQPLGLRLKVMQKDLPKRLNFLFFSDSLSL